MNGLLVAICGLDGSGKTTQIKLLEDWFSQKRLLCLLTKQPTNHYRQDERVRKYLDFGECTDMKVLALLSAADRRWHLSNLIEPTLEKGTSVITDRYIYSSLAYFKVRGLDPSYVKSVNGDIREPDLTVFLDVDPSVSLSRVQKRDGSLTKYEERTPNMFHDIKNAFKEVLPENALIVDGALDVDVIHKLIISRIEEKLTNVERGISIGAK
ncbi:dTMP kinase [Metabacillus idriensis]|uniref:dTMP kinase n=1 Tax=Metabacillus idriensis TaxID=324768 RepID=UPI001CD7EC54|nr:dTMP kinase [Metabacillus idriensis]